MNAYDTLYNVVFSNPTNTEADHSLITLAGEALMTWLKDEDHDQATRPQMSEEFMEKLSLDCDPDDIEARLDSLDINKLNNTEQEWLNDFRREYEREMWEAEQDERDLHAEFNHQVFLSLRGR